MIPYELLKIYRDIGINLYQYNYIVYIGSCEFEYHEDKFIYNAF